MTTVIVLTLSHIQAAFTGVVAAWYWHRRHPWHHTTKMLSRNDAYAQPRASKAAERKFGPQ
jgi:hypothetical protein